jgi:hypothetical protein
MTAPTETEPKTMRCAVCGANAVHYLVVDGYSYSDCGSCGSIAIDAETMAVIDAGKFVRDYQADYWQMELVAARQRAWGDGLARVAEALLYARLPVHRFIDIASGPGFLLDSLADLLPHAASRFFAVEKFPPEEHTSNPNYIIGDLAEAEGTFQAGSCIEVIEHLTPGMLGRLAASLALKSEPGSLYIFNSANPSYVKEVDSSYLDPLRRGHIISWGHNALVSIFEPLGFTVTPIQGKNFAFVVEFKRASIEPLSGRIWYPLDENKAILTAGPKGALLYILGLDGVRAYLC